MNLLRNWVATGEVPMPSLRRTIALLIMLGNVNISPSVAAEFSYRCDDMLCYIQLKGEIERGDAEQFLSMLTQLNESGSPVERLILLSKGGDVAEALSIGRIVREAFIFTYAPQGNKYIPSLPKNLVPGTEEARDALNELKRNSFSYFTARTLDGQTISSSGRAVEIFTALGNPIEYNQDAVCASACALIAISGLIRFGTVGLHHMYVNDTEIDYDELDAILSDSTDEVSDYLAEMRAPASFLENIVSTPSKEMKWVDLYAIGSIDPIFQEYAYGKCGGLTEEQMDDQLDLELLSKHGSYFDIDTNQIIERAATIAEQEYLQELKAISERSSQCKDALYLNAQKKAQAVD